MRNLPLCTRAFLHAGFTALEPPLGTASQTPLPPTRYALLLEPEGVAVLKASITAVRLLVRASSSSSLDPTMASNPASSGPLLIT